MSNSGWRKVVLAVLTYDRGRFTLGNTGNKFKYAWRCCYFKN